MASAQTSETEDRWALPDSGWRVLDTSRCEQFIWLGALLAKLSNHGTTAECEYGAPARKPPLDVACLPWQYEVGLKLELGHRFRVRGRIRNAARIVHVTSNVPVLGTIRRSCVELPGSSNLWQHVMTTPRRRARRVSTTTNRQLRTAPNLSALVSFLSLQCKSARKLSARRGGSRVGSSALGSGCVAGWCCYPDRYAGRNQENPLSRDSISDSRPAAHSLRCPFEFLKHQCQLHRHVSRSSGTVAEAGEVGDSRLWTCNEIRELRLVATDRIVSLIWTETYHHSVVCTNTDVAAEKLLEPGPIRDQPYSICM